MSLKKEEPSMWNFITGDGLAFLFFFIVAELYKIFHLFLNSFDGGEPGVF